MDVEAYITSCFDLSWCCHYLPRSEMAADMAPSEQQMDDEPFEVALRQAVRQSKLRGKLPGLPGWELEEGILIVCWEAAKLGFRYLTCSLTRSGPTHAKMA